MKYWNKQHKLRKKWYKISLPRVFANSPWYTNTNLNGNFEGWTRYDEFDEMKRGLQMVDSPGKFYMNIMKKDVYFECERDAVYFSLRYL